ncbi:transporter [Sphingobacterium sp. SRCM116780]|uniref:transporter n=1 Tax=Sphingobacterium sp. SRCM116780 TaxID=2907623 RepID=UPI001F2835FA|nr:transporter [Sphingobacterium sp. SRCM116780]UIR56041.1 transporter [Sphingobacterium sp. SRCM116780]
MKLKIMILFSILLMGFSSQACDICGCGVGSYYMGILPEFNKRFIGLRYQYNSLQSHLGPQGERTALTEDEKFHIAELWGAFQIGTRFRVMAFLPYNFNSREAVGMDEKTSKSGLGDIAVMGYYKVFESTHQTSNNRLFAHSLWAGAGVKLPTGKYDVTERDISNTDQPNNFQLGTGSTDFTANLAYDARLMDLGMNVNASYKINTTNSDDYLYGNKFTGNMLFYYKFLLNEKLRIAPNAGVRYENAAKDLASGQFDVAQSGGYMTSAILGAEVNVGKVSFGANWQAPINQNLGNHRVEAGNRVMTHVSFSF